MEEALQQLVTDSLDLSKRKIAGPAGPITVTMDTRALAPDHRIYYRNLHKFRVSQMNDGVDLTDLSDEQWGMVQLDKCHHISTTSTSKDGPQSFRVRICKTCCQEDSHIELGTYVDQESAILVNDTFEILNERLERLIVLRIEDKPDLHYLVAKKYDRSKGRDYACILDLISERIAAIDGKKRKPGAPDAIPTFAKRAGEAGYTPTSNDTSTSSEASDELQRSRNSSSSALKAVSASASQSSLQSAMSAPNSRHNSARKLRDGIVRRISISTPGDEDAASNSGSSHLGDDDITVTEDAGLALRELSSVCYQRLISPSIVNTIPGSADLVVGTVVTGTSMFTTTASTSDLLRSLEKVRTPSSLSHSATHSAAHSAAKGPTIYSADRPLINSPFSGSNGSHHSSPTSHSTAVHSYREPDSAASSTAEHAHSTLKSRTDSPHAHEHPTSNNNNNNNQTGSLHKRSRPAQDDSASDVAAAYTNDRLALLDGQTPRKRAATFSVSQPYPYYSQMENNPIATLTWLASMEDEEVDVARSLFELRGNGGSSMFAGLNGASTGPLSSYSNGQDNEDDFYQQYLEGHKNHSDLEENDNDEEEEEEEEEEDEGMDYTHYLTTMNNMSRGGFNYPGTFEHNGKLYQSNLGYGGLQLHNNVHTSHSANSLHMNLTHQHPLSLSAGMHGGTFSRPRSSSLSMIDRGSSEGASWAILGSTGGYRSKVDPLSMALKKYHERGGSANAAASGFVGIYSPEDRKTRIMRFLEKRKRRMWTKKVKYDVRKNFADSRVRVKGRFVKKQEEDGDGLNTSRLSQGSFDDTHLHNSSLNNSGYGEDDQDEEEEEEGDESPGPVISKSSGASKNNNSSSALNLKLKFTKPTTATVASATSSSSTPTPTSTTSGSAKKREKAEVVKSEAGKNDLKLTITSRRRRNSSVGDAEALSHTTTTTGKTATTPHSADLPGATASDHAGGDHHSSPSTVALKLEKATLASATKPAPVY